MAVSCPHYLPSSLSKPRCFPRACPGGTERHPSGADTALLQGGISRWCSACRSVSQSSSLPATHFPGHTLRSQPGLCEHRVCFARVTCLIISFSGGRLFLVSTVTAPLRGEAIRQRVKQVIKTLKPCARWEGAAALTEMRRALPGSLSTVWDHPAQFPASAGA